MERRCNPQCTVCSTSQAKFVSLNCCGRQGHENYKAENRTDIYNFLDKDCSAVHTSNNLYCMLFQTIVSLEANDTSTSRDNLRLWHERTRNINLKTLCELGDKGSVKVCN